MIDMNVGCSNDRGVVVVLEIGELLFQFSLVVIVHQREYPEPRGGWMLNVFFNEACANEVPESFRPVEVACAFDEAVKPLEEIGVDRDAES
jgi:hypothetical protein